MRRSGSRPDAPAGEFTLVLVDGDNLLHRVRGSRDEGGLRWLLPRLRAWRPAGVEILVMLDGHPDVGETLRRRVAPGIEFRQSGSVSADDALVAVLVARPYAGRSITVLVTDDRALADRARHAGGMARRVDWLTAQLAKASGSVAAAGGSPGSAPGVGRGAPTAGGGTATRGGASSQGVGRGVPPAGGGTASESHGSSDSEREHQRPWRPGRGATRKHGNARRLPKAARPSRRHSPGRGGGSR